MKSVYFVTYPSTKPWGSNFFYEKLLEFSVNNVIEITPKQSTKIKNSVLFYHNVQTIPKNFMRGLGVNTLKRRGNTVIAGFRGHVGFDKWKWVIPDLDYVVCNIDEELTMKVKELTYSFTVFYPGVDSEIFKPLNMVKTTDVSWVGRDHKKFKNTDILSKLGCSYEKATYKQYIPHHELPVFLNQSKIHIVTSDHEGFCRPALEAALCGIPVVAPRIGVVPHIIDDEWTIDGSPRGAVDQYKELIEMLLSDPELYKRVGEENRVRALNFSWEHSAKIFDKIIREQTK